MSDDIIEYSDLLFTQMLKRQQLPKPHIPLQSVSPQRTHHRFKTYKFNSKKPKKTHKFSISDLSPKKKRVYTKHNNLSRSLKLNPIKQRRGRLNSKVGNSLPQIKKRPRNTVSRSKGSNYSNIAIPTKKYLSKSFKIDRPELNPQTRKNTQKSFTLAKTKSKVPNKSKDILNKVRRKLAKMDKKINLYKN